MFGVLFEETETLSFVASWDSFPIAWVCVCVCESVGLQGAGVGWIMLHAFRWFSPRLYAQTSAGFWFMFCLTNILWNLLGKLWTWQAAGWLTGWPQLQTLPTHPPVWTKVFHFALCQFHTLPNAAGRTITFLPIACLGMRGVLRVRIWGKYCDISCSLFKAVEVKNALPTKLAYVCE